MHTSIPIYNQIQPVPTDKYLFLLRIIRTFQELSMGSARPLVLVLLRAELSV